MATSKLLKPTNVTISIPEFTDQPDQRVNSNCIDKEADAINTLSEQIGICVLVSKAITTTSGYQSDWQSDIFDLPTATNGRNIYTCYNSGTGSYGLIMKRASDQKISSTIQFASGQTVYISGIAK